MFGDIIFWGSTHLFNSTPEDRIAYEHRQKLLRLKDKDARMNRRLQRHRDQIWERNWMIVWQIAFWLCVPALAIAGVAAVWRFCAWVVTA